MKNYHYILISLLCLWFIGASIIAKSINELLENFLIFIVSLGAISIAIIIHLHESNRKPKQQNK